MDVLEHPKLKHYFIAEEKAVAAFSAVKEPKPLPWHPTQEQRDNYDTEVGRYELLRDNAKRACEVAAAVVVAFRTGQDK